MEYVGEFARRTLRKLGVRIPVARYHDGVAKPEEAAFIPTAIHGNRIYLGKEQYQVQWLGYSDLTWHDADTLDCYDLIEEYETSKDVLA